MRRSYTTAARHDGYPRMLEISCSVNFDGLPASGSLALYQTGQDGAHSRIRWATNFHVPIGIAFPGVLCAPQRRAECVGVNTYGSSHIFGGCAIGDHVVSYAFSRIYIGRFHNSTKELGHLLKLQTETSPHSAGSSARALTALRWMLGALPVMRLKALEKALRDMAAVAAGSKVRLFGVYAD